MPSERILTSLTIFGNFKAEPPNETNAEFFAFPAAGMIPECLVCMPRVPVISARKACRVPLTEVVVNVLNVSLDILQAFVVTPGLFPARGGRTGSELMMGDPVPGKSMLRCRAVGVGSCAPSAVRYYECSSNVRLGSIKASFASWIGIYFVSFSPQSP